jgi:hypothetical protein
VIGGPAFNPDKMAEYIRASKGIVDDDSGNPLWQSVDHLSGRAWAVKEYFTESP